VQEDRNQIDRRVREEQALIDEEEQNLEEQEAILAAKARSRGARVRQELDRRRFEVGAALSESLAQIEDDYANDMGSAHSLDAVSISNWVDGTSNNRGPEGDNTTPFVTNPNTSQPASGPDVTNATEPVMTNVDPCTRPFGATMLSSPEIPSRAEATDFVAEVPAHAHTHVAHNARFSSVDRGGDESWNITTCRDIPSDMLIDLTLTIQEFAQQKVLLENLTRDPAMI
jgi:hypothetical protein